MDQVDADRRMGAYKIFMGIRARDGETKEMHDDIPIVETRRVVSLQLDKPSGMMKKSGSSKKEVSGGSLVMKCMVYEIDTSV